jgi:hypothetical protein
LCVEDCGCIINPRLVDEQLRRAIVQGIGAALYEHLVYDEHGQLLTGTMMDYLVPMAAEMPEIVVGHVETPTAYAEGGFKGAGEAGTAGAPGAVLNAVNDALGPFGAGVTASITPEVKESSEGPSRGQGEGGRVHGLASRDASPARVDPRDVAGGRKHRRSVTDRASTPAGRDGTRACDMDALLANQLAEGRERARAARSRSGRRVPRLEVGLDDVRTPSEGFGPEGVRRHSDGWPRSPPAEEALRPSSRRARTPCSGV